MTRARSTGRSTSGSTAATRSGAGGVTRSSASTRAVPPWWFFPGRSDLPQLLAERGIDTVIMTGTTTNVTLHVVYRSYGDVRPAVEVIALIRRGLQD